MNALVTRKKVKPSCSAVTLARTGAVLAMTAWYATQTLHALPIAHAQGVLPGETVSTNPKTRTTTVTASVKDSTNPTVPVLVSPENGSLLSTNLVTFIWKESTDDAGIAKYQLIVDGSVWLDNVGPGAETETDYTLTASSGSLTLVPKKTLGDGNHTWKVKAFDTNGNTSESATWSFTVDTTAPVITISAIDGTSVSITSKDTTTIPTTAISVPKNEPELKGSTDGGITVKLILTVPGRPTYTAQTTSNGSGAFSFVLPILPSGVVITAQLQAVDAAGNTGVLDNLLFLIPPAKIPAIIPIIPGLIPTPTPGIIPLPTPTPAPGLPLEEVRPIFREKVEEILSRTVFPAPGQVQFIEKTYVRPISNFLFGLILPSAHLAVAIWLSEYAVIKLSPLRVGRLMRAGGLTLLPPPPEEHQGLVFDARSGKPVPYAVLEIYRLSQETSQPGKRVAELVTNAFGRYPAIRLPAAARYALIVKQRYQEFRAELGPLYEKKEGYFWGQSLDDKTLPKVEEDGVTAVEIRLKVPTLLKKEYENTETGWRKYLKTLTTHPSALSTPSFAWIGASVFLTILAFWAFTPWNIGMAIFYWIGTARHFIYKQPILVHKI